VHQTFAAKALQNTGQGTWMQMHELRKLPCRNARKSAHDPNHEPLRTGHAKRGLHALGCFLQGMIEGPQQTHEL
jgi:hypothetical protein